MNNNEEQETITTQIEYRVLDNGAVEIKIPIVKSGIEVGYVFTALPASLLRELFDNSQKVIKSGFNAALTDTDNLPGSLLSSHLLDSTPIMMTAYQDKAGETQLLYSTISKEELDKIVEGVNAIRHTIMERAMRELNGATIQ
jgi:hypothetical protein